MEPAPKKLKLKKDGTPSRQGEGGGRTRVYTKEVLDVMAEDMIEWFKIPTNFWLMDFATDRGFYWDQFGKFAERSERFDHALKVCKCLQVSKLVKMGISKKFNTAMPIFALKNVAGWRDEMAMRHSGAVKTGGLSHMDDPAVIAMASAFAKHVMKKREAKGGG